MAKHFRQARQRVARQGNSGARRPLVEPLEERQLLSNIFTVTNTLDNRSTGSLRWAITQVNGDASDSAANPDQIQFDIPKSDAGYSGGIWTIAPATALPAVTKPAVINGYTQPGASPNTDGPGLADNAVMAIVLSGAHASENINGLELSSAGIVLRGLVINGFSTTMQNNGGAGVLIDTAGSDTIEGNFIGTNPAGTEAVANTTAGILSFGFGDNTIGGTTPDAVNVISGNTGDGIDFIGANASANLIAGNIVGADASGRHAIPNENGVEVSSGSGNTIGGTTPGARNLISGNVTDGLGVGGNQGAGDVIEGNYIGTDITGDAPLIKVLGDGLGAGIVVGGSPTGNTVGGTIAGAGNVVSGNDNGILVTGGGQTIIEGNLIGTDATGLQPVGNFYGVFLVSLTDSSATTIGGTTAQARNVISANATENIAVSGVTSQTVIEGNYIGLNRSGDSALNGPFILGEVYGGVQIIGASGVTVGGTKQGAGNVISGNRGVGIEISESFLQGQGTQGNLAEGNLIGTDATGGKSVPNQIGVKLDSFSDIGGVSGNTIGGTATGAGNTIAYNTAGGVVVTGDTTTGNTIAENAIFANGKLGIDLGGTGKPLANTPGGPHTGPNDLQNHPVLSSSYFANGVTTVTGRLNSTPNQSFRIEFFSSPAPDPSGFGQGRTFVGAIDVSTDANGNTAPFTFTYSGDPNSQSITATATDPNGNTSEFSNAVLPSGYSPPVQLTALPNPSTSGQPVTLTASLQGTASSSVATGMIAPTGTVTFFADGTALGAPVPLETASGGLTGTSQASLTISSLPTGTHTITARYNGGNDLPSSSSPIALTINPSDLTVLSVQRYGIHRWPTTVVLTFNAPLDTTSAEATTNYVIVGPRHRVIPVKLALYNAAADTVTLTPTRNLNVHLRYTLIVNGTAPHGVADIYGNLLDGAGHNGTNYVTTLTRRNLVLTRHPARLQRERR